ncbi:MAG: hypothetical protein J0H99_26030 [Rhodospirillales bacterium]|nr:hypothetical protein [Rhodospirillales bacterium]
MFTGKAVAYWRKGLRTQNFGDLLSELLFRELTGRSLLNPFTGRRVAPFDTIHLLGSVISNYHVTADLEHGRGFGAQKIAFWCCGKRDGSTLDEELLEHCVFLGARGPLTRDALHLPAETPLGDPALLLPAIYRPHIDRNLADKTLCVPHFLEKKPDSQPVPI